MAVGWDRWRGGDQSVEPVKSVAVLLVGLADPEVVLVRRAAVGFGRRSWHPFEHSLSNSA